MIKIPGEGAYITSSERVHTDNFLVKLFKQLIARITSLFQSIVGKNAPTQEGVKVTSLLEKKVEKLDVKKDATEHVKTLDTLVRQLQNKPGEKIGVDFFRLYEKLPVSIQGEFSKFLKMKMKRGKTTLTMTQREIIPFFYDLKRLGSTQ